MCDIAVHRKLQLMSILWILDDLDCIEHENNYRHHVLCLAVLNGTRDVLKSTWNICVEYKHEQIEKTWLYFFWSSGKKLCLILKIVRMIIFYRVNELVTGKHLNSFDRKHHEYRIKKQSPYIQVPKEKLAPRKKHIMILKLHRALGSYISWLKEKTFFPEETLCENISDLS